ncbi:branched-chain amino acid aminotransferase [Brumimicrobium aurantiacum]|uniref:branched-chain-amino-acid transaminase n=1 Tax=Brumimicrobium aurantiacum TaxID=1737063 RepID=A0A3E1EWE2_9FLAO|nr:branched-chain amino acid aminotransferase [Brumimicrobium aurantiacum]RFC53875.1 branched-chain amino acid aminotransferase [Brumimicrobium aurantiacum]
METSQYTIKKTRTKNSKIDQVDWDNIPFGKLFSDHMLIMDYKDGKWQEPEIVPFENLSLHPATSAIHYGQSIFEGMKAYRTVDGEPVVFRPEKNAQRFRKSAHRMCMADIPEDLFIYCLEELLKFDDEWVPKKDTNSMYIRPFMFATDGYTGIKPSDTYRFMIFTCPVGSYYTEAINLKIEENYTRAAYGGVGAAKAAGNYAASLYPAKLAQDEGFHQLIWTDAQTHEYVEEAGTMNILFVIDGKLVTPKESDTILAGITKRSVIEVAQDWGMTVEERKISVKEIIESIEDGSLTEAFGAGTAATIAPVKMIGYKGKKYELPGEEKRTFSKKVVEELDGMKYGKIEDRFGWVKKIK